ncbi:ATP-binding cassette domain-containing protein [Ideonella sp. B7]|uniref:ABC transporter ATP-binding protein n=1 Tax=Ideonella benzenivorans TaxID=2831643 RepID=UPI001CEC9F6D|nr:ATP-binding cassette domain-containing protein [Ideonella benzenivorans]MCA6218691.1 ATP-binding cassette domain-containing protein [Ideonella benzenivorans]
MIDVDLKLTVADRHRRFDLAMRFASDAPVVALFGPSGAGKSLTLQAIAGLIRPQAGHVRIGGRTLYDQQAGVDLPAAQRGVGYLFQDYALFPHLTVRQNVGFGLTSWRRRQLGAADARRVDGLLETFGLTALAASRPEGLSGGQRQRVALARALACEPALLLLDEPFAALNPMLRQSLRQELALVRQRWRIPMLLITHDVEDVLALADVACVVEHGQVIRAVDVGQGMERAAVHRSLGLAPPPLEDDRTRAVRRLLALPGAL